jgi:hypothetical protein
MFDLAKPSKLRFEMSEVPKVGGQPGTYQEKWGSRVGKWRYKVPGPTPASLAMSSRLAFAPDRVNASLAASKMRSRFRCASARGFRSGGCDRFVGISKNVKKTCNRRPSPTISSSAETLSVLCEPCPLVSRHFARLFPNQARGPGSGGSGAAENQSCNPESAKLYAPCCFCHAPLFSARREETPAVDGPQLQTIVGRLQIVLA